MMKWCKMNIRVFCLIILCSMLGIVLLPLQGRGQNDIQNSTVSDSLLKQYSIEDLLEYKKYYQGKIKTIEHDKNQLRQITVTEAEAFIKQHPESKILDKVFMRLAELYYKKSIEIYLKAEQEYDNQLTDFDNGLLKTAPKAPKKDFSKSLNLYEQLLKKYPHSNLVDDAIYNKGFVLDELGDMEKALQVYQILIDEYPDSRYIPEAYMRIAEYHFNPPQNNIEKSIEIYKEVLSFKDSPRYDEALYRLGWSYYRLNMYPEAVAYFTLLADDIERSKVLDPGQKYTNPALREESVEYIGISFLDYGGVEGAAAYLKDIGGREYGTDVLQKIGDVYMKEKEEYEKAIQAYQTFLNVYPDSPDAPAIQSKIILAYRYLEDDMLAYLARKTLFDKYQPESEWWNRCESPEAREKARELSEKSAVENVNLLFQRANELNDNDLYLQAVQDSRSFLKVFPKDSHAVNIHWNMAVTLDMKLNKPDEAFVEYMKISDLYWDTKHQKWAAENAIALAKDAATNADSLAQLGREESKTIAQMQGEIEDNKELTAALHHKSVIMEKEDLRLAEAYNSYIMLFPHEKESAIFLANAGALYYNHNQFEKALIYFNTLVRHFPGGQDVDYAKYRIMECYFGKRDFKSSEVVARKLKESAKTPGLAEKANKRLGESVFLSAEALADSGSHLKAGNEYVRVVIEVPDIQFADLALFKGALQYDEAEEYRRAVETYDYLIENYPGSKYRLDAINNLALDYGELNDFRNAAISYEKLAKEHPDSLRARDALYNSSVFYVRANDWKSAIRVNKEYVHRYPNSEDADDLYFDIAGYHLKLDEIDNANRIYGEYAQKYPYSTRVVESYFRRGEYYRKNSKPERAKQEFALAVKKNQELKANNYEVNDYFTAEALFALTQLKYDEFLKIEFAGSPAKIEEAKKVKKALLLEVVENYTNVARYGTIRLYEATYNIGKTYEDFASAWARQELPQMEATKRAVALNEVNQAASSLYERSVKSYTDGVEVLTRIADDYEAYLENKKLASTDSTVENVPDSSTAAQKGGRVSIEDSTLYIARKWIDRSKEKVSEIVYDIAELNHASVNRFLTAPLPEGLDAVSELEYRNQVLNRAIRPMVEQIVAAHVRNVTVSHEMDLKNQWVDQSKKKIITTSNVLAVEYKRMAADALVIYSEKSDLYLSMVKEGKDAIDISDQMATLIDYANAFSRATVKLYQNSITTGREQSIEDIYIEESEIEMLKTAYTVSMEMDSLAREVDTRRKECEKIFKNTDRIEFENAIFIYEENFFSFKESKKALLETGYNISNEMGIANLWTNHILFELVKTAPETYRNLLDLKSTSQAIISDATWKATKVYQTGWTAFDYDDSNWRPSLVLGIEASQSGTESRRIWLMEIDTVVTHTTPFEPVVDPTDSLALIAAASDSVGNDSLKFATGEPADSSGISGTPTDDSSRFAAIESSDSTGIQTEQPLVTTDFKSVPVKKAYFRKIINVEGLPISGEILLSVDDSYNLFLNGEYIAASRTDSSNWQNETVHQLQDYLRLGRNLVAIEGIDTDKTGNGMKVVFNYSYLPEWAEKQKQFKFRIMDSTEKESLIFNKNIIVY